AAEQAPVAAVHQPDPRERVLQEERIEAIGHAPVVGGFGSVAVEHECGVGNISVQIRVFAAAEQPDHLLRPMRGAGSSGIIGKHVPRPAAVAQVESELWILVEYSGPVAGSGSISVCRSGELRKAAMR